MAIYGIVQGTAARETLIQSYEAVLFDASTELSEGEYKHFVDVASVGYEHAAQKDDYVAALYDTLTEWASEARRKTFYLAQGSMEIDFAHCYNENCEVKERMQEKRSFSVIPVFFVWFGAIVLALSCISATVFVMGLCQKSFLINPVYLFMFIVGFLGLLLTDIAAIAEWRKTRDVQK